MAGAAALVLTACGSGSGSGAGSSDVDEPVTLVDGTPTAAVVQGSDGSRRRLEGPALAAVLAPAAPLAAFKTVEDSGDRYGFEAPRYVVAFESPAGRVMLVIGAPTFDGGGVYARRCGDDRVHLVTRTLVSAVERIAADGQPENGPRLEC